MGGRKPVIEYKGGMPQQMHNYAAGIRSVEFRRPVSMGRGQGNLQDPDTGQDYQAQTPLNRIPTQVHPREFTRMVRNIDTALRSVPPQKVREAHDWYLRAHDEAGEIGRKAGAGNHAHEVGAGILAALSPQTDWDQNVREAHNVAMGGHVSQQYGGFKTSAHKAYRVLEGENPDEVLGPLKTGNFYHNIKDPSDSSYATIDSHQHNLAVGWKHPWKSSVYGLQSRNRYDTLVRATAAVAKRHDIPVTAAQAGAWTGWKELNTGYRGANYPVRKN